jgi:hypothetical protein
MILITVDHGESVNKIQDIRLSRYSYIQHLWPATVV